MAAHPMRVLSLCSGVGMHDLALGTIFAARTVCYVEREAYSASQLVGLMEAGCLDAAPVWSDLATFDARAWRGVVDCIVAGLPCQPYSGAGKQLGNDDARSFGEGDGPIVHFLRIVAECRPAVVFLENVPDWVANRKQWFRPVGDELCRLGYEVEEPLFVAASDVGASHQRKRVWLMAYQPGRGQRVVRAAWRGLGCAEQDGGELADARRESVFFAQAGRSERLGEARGHCERSALRIGGGGAALAIAEGGNGRREFSARAAGGGRSGLAGNVGELVNALRENREGGGAR